MPKFSISLIILDIWQGFEYASDINMPRYSYNNIIIIVTKIEFLSARFVHPGALQLSISSFFWHELEHKNNES